LASKIESLDLTLQQEITQAKLNFESTLINNFTQVNSNKIYSHIKSITKSKSLPATIHFDSNSASTNTDKANLFTSYFYCFPGDIFLVTQKTLNSQLLSLIL